MKRVIRSASFGGYKYQYEVHWLTPSGEDKLLGGSNSLSGAERIALDQLNRISTSPWETSQRKQLFIENCYIYDSKNDTDVTTDVLSDKIDELLDALQ